MVPFRTFKGTRDGRQVTNHALGNSGFRGWCVIRSSASVDENLHQQIATISKVSVEGPSPALSAAGNPVIALMDHSGGVLAVDFLKGLEAMGMMRRTDHFIRQVLPQGVMQLPMFEVLVPEAELIRHCEGCNAWEKVAKPRFKKCAKCKVVYYCSEECQKKDWKAFHKALCKEGLTVKEVHAMQKDKLDGLLTKAGLQAGTYYYPQGSHYAVL